MKRVVASYKLAIKEQNAARGGMWLDIFESRHVDIHQALLEGDLECVSSLFQDPGSNYLLYGIDPLFTGFHQTIWSEETLIEHCADSLIRLGEATGACRAYFGQTPELNRCFISVEERLTLLDNVIGIVLDFPNPYRNEFGVETSRGIMAWKAPDSIYQAWRVRTLVGSGKILEIGGGVGRAAYYANRMGLKDYSIVDLPLSLAIQAYFLATALGEDAVTLFGETHASDITLVPQSAFFCSEDKYDLVLNSNSITELDAASIYQYWRAISQRSKVFLSMNHEANEVRVRDLAGTTTERFPHWIRDGYVEEIIRF